MLLFPVDQDIQTGMVDEGQFVKIHVHVRVGRHQFQCRRQLRQTHEGRGAFEMNGDNAVFFLLLDPDFKVRAGKNGKNGEEWGQVLQSSTLCPPVEQITAHISHTPQPLVKIRGQCGLARPRVLAGESPAWVVVSREPRIDPCGAVGNRRVDA